MACVEFILVASAMPLRVFQLLSSGQKHLASCALAGLRSWQHARQFVSFPYTSLVASCGHVVSGPELEALHSDKSGTSQEFLCLSIDATLKVCMTAQGQANYRASAQVRNAACFDDGHSLRRVLTIKGHTGAVLGIVPVPCEDSPKIKESLCQLFSNRQCYRCDIWPQTAHLPSFFAN